MAKYPDPDDFLADFRARVPDSTDTRAKIVRLTKRGVALHAASAEVRLEMQSVALVKLGKALAIVVIQQHGRRLFLHCITCGGMTANSNAAVGPCPTASLAALNPTIGEGRAASSSATHPLAGIVSDTFFQRVKTSHVIELSTPLDNHNQESSSD